jgi:O-antigen biosynthesis protein
MDEHSRKKIEQAQYRAKLVEAELAAVKSSKAYRVTQLLGIIRAQVASDPVGLTKKVARIMIQEPGKLTRLGRRVANGSVIAQNVVEQNNKYQEWILLHEPDEAELDAQRLASEALVYKPTISIITPVFNPPVKVLEELIESVLEQTYPYFELCLGDFGDDPEVKALITKYAGLDERIRDLPFTDNKGIAHNSNQILEKATGEYIALLDHDDTLSPDALYENAKLLNEERHDCIYSDKDKIDEQNHRFDPLFKPKWSPEMMLNVNYLTHLNVMRTELVRQIGGWDTETDGAQDWDLFLRVVSEANSVAHIPKVLYHWRVIASSTALSIDTKPYALAGQRRAIDKHLQKNGIPAKAYHQHTELMLKWDADKFDQQPLVFIRFTSITNTARLMRTVRKVVKSPEFVVVTVVDSGAERSKLISKQLGCPVLECASGEFAAKVDDFVGKYSGKGQERTVLFLRDIIRLPQKNSWYEHLVGWLNISDVEVVGGRLVDRRDSIVNSGGIVGNDGVYRPIFQGYPRYYQSYIGNAEWVRNLSVVSPWFLATKLSLLRAHPFGSAKTDTESFDRYCLNVAKQGRLVMNPHATGAVYDADQAPDLERQITALQAQIKKHPFEDPYGNVNLSPQDPLRLFDDEPLIGIDNGSGEQQSINEYQHDAVILANTFDITEAEMQANRHVVGSRGALQPTSVAWFLPSYEKAYAGLMSIFGFANYMADQQGLRTTFYIITGTGDVSKERAETVAKFPALAKAQFVAMTPDQLDSIKPHDIGIATQWATAYPLAKSTVFKRKAYFIQDNEPNFYPGGTVSALAELSYQFGFYGIASTEGLMDMYKGYGGHGTILPSRVDLTAFKPPQSLRYEVKKPYKVFFYARPGMPRNAFELGIAGLKKLKEKLGDDVEILLAGAAWDSRAYGVEGMFTNLGLLSLEAVPKFYQSLDAGLMFMFSGHPGVTASELMASGCPVVVNEYDDKTWRELYQHEKTCMVSLPTASEVARNLERCLVDKKARKTLIDGGLTRVATFYTGYDKALETAYKDLIKG